MSESEKLKSGAIVVERFRLERLLGQGGMGSVWLAHHLGLDIPCAVKFLKREAAESADVRNRFEREAKAAARLKSPHVVQTLDHGVWEGIPYIAMEYLEGEDLNHRLKRLRRLDPRDLVRITVHVARALTKAHAAGLVHRDLKPSNIFLVKDDEHEIAKVLDFGVAKLQVTEQSVGDQEETRAGSLLGTPHYMSPEQAQGTRVVDHRSDLWSLAVVVFQSITGKLPFQSEALGDLLVQIIVHEPPIPSHVAQVPPTFDVWWKKAVARDPNERFQSAREMSLALATALGVVADREGSANEFGGQWSGSGQGSVAPPSFDGSSHHPFTPHPTPISSIAPHDGPASSGMSASGPTANLVAQSVSIAEPPRRSRKKRVVIFASIVGIALGGAVAVLAPSVKTTDEALGAAAGSAATTASASVAPVSTPAPVQAAPSAAPSSSEAAVPTMTLPPYRFAPSANPQQPPSEYKPKPQSGPKQSHKHPDFGI